MLTTFDRQEGEYIWGLHERCFIAVPSYLGNCIIPPKALDTNADSGHRFFVLNLPMMIYESETKTCLKVCGQLLKKFIHVIKVR
jgi:hypothetical protein